MDLPPPDVERSRTPHELLALGQGAYYVLGGLWPLISIGTFQWVTGRKRDLWLVKTVGLLLAIVGAVLGLAGFRRRVTPEVALLGAGSAVGMAGVDLVYVANGTLRPVYLLDAAAEAALVVGWAAASPFSAWAGGGKTDEA